MKKQTFVFFVLCIALAVPKALNAAMTGGNFEIYADSLSFSDTATSTGGIFALTGTGGGIATTSTATNLVNLRGGFQAADKGILSFALDQTSINVGVLSPLSVSSASVTMTVSTDSQTGYSVVASADGPLRTAAGDTISYVSSGNVSAGTSGYGIRTSGGDGVISTDTGMSSAVTIASSSGTVNLNQTTVQFHASVNTAAIPGNYTQTVTFTTTVNP